MDWFIFVLISLGWITSAFLYLEKKTIIRTYIFAGFSFLLGGGLLIDGISFPTGWTIVTSGTTQTITQTFTDYTQANNAWILGIGWALFANGLYHMVETWTGIIVFMGDAVRKVRDKIGL